MKNILRGVGVVLLALNTGALAEEGQAMAIPDPEDGSIVGNAYDSKYFGLSYPLPSGWQEGLKGPPPSFYGYYVLSAIDGLGEGKPSLLIAAQDMFFGAKPMMSSEAQAKELRDAEMRVPNMAIDREPSETKLAGRRFTRVDYSAGGLYRAWLGTEIRCHVVIFHITTTDRKSLQEAVASLDKMSEPREGVAPAPACVRDYAVDENLVKRVEPKPVGPMFRKIPARVIIGTDGQVRHIHVINAFPEQKSSIEEALAQWRFKPYEASGHSAEVETGIVFEFKPERSN